MNCKSKSKIKTHPSKESRLVPDSGGQGLGYNLQPLLFSLRFKSVLMGSFSGCVWSFAGFCGLLSVIIGLVIVMWL